MSRMRTEYAYASSARVQDLPVADLAAQAMRATGHSGVYHDSRGREYGEWS